MDFTGGSTNLYAYASNLPTSLTDALGLDVTIVQDKGVTPLHHLTRGVNQQTPVGLQPQGDSWDFPAFFGFTVPGEIAPNATPPRKSITIKTTPEQDLVIERAIEEDSNDPPDYNIIGNNCAREVDKLLRKAGLSTPGDLTPESEINHLADQYHVPIKHY